MTSFGRIVTNAGWNLTGNVLPLAAAAALLPFIISTMGIDRFGLLSLAWVLVGYFSLFDLGLGRAITKMVAEREQSESANDIPAIASTGSALVIAVGFIGAICIAALAPLVESWLHDTSATLANEARNSVYLIALSIPFVVGTSALRGVLEGLQEFRLLTFIRVPAGILLFAAPAITSLLSPRLDLAVAGLVLTRAALFAAHIPPALRRIRIRPSSFQRQWVRPMIHFGGWLTVSSIVGPVIVYMDRFVLGAVQTPTAVAYYAAPFEIVSRMLIIPAALSAALFPAIAGLKQKSAKEADAMYRKALALIVLILTPICVAGAALAEPLLNLWLGSSFAANSAPLLQLLLPGFALNSLAQLPLVALHGLGRAKSVAVLHLVQLPIYCALLIFLSTKYGATGAATAWSIRAASDCLALFLMLRLNEKFSTKSRADLQG